MSGHLVYGHGSPTFRVFKATSVRGSIASPVEPLDGIVGSRLLILERAAVDEKRDLVKPLLGKGHATTNDGLHRRVISPARAIEVLLFPTTLPWSASALSTSHFDDALFRRYEELGGSGGVSPCFARLSWNS